MGELAHDHCHFHSDIREEFRGRKAIHVHDSSCHMAGNVVYIFTQAMQCNELAAISPC